MFDSDEFIEDMKNGLSVEEGLKKHNISLEEAVVLLQKSLPRKKKKKKNTWNAKTGEKYISKTKSGKYSIRKHINGKMRYFGNYDNINDAIKVRDYLIENGWYYNRINAIRKRLGV